MIQRIRDIFNQHFVLVIALLATLVVYFKFFYFAHISWDDPEMVFKNKAVKSFDLKALFTGHFVGNYIPVTMLVHSLTWLLFEGNDGGHHFVNILFHLINGVLVYAVVNRLFKNKSVTYITVIVFLLHPLQLESVGWISELKNLVSTTFYLLGILRYLRFFESKKQKDYLITILFFVLGCLSKSSAVVFPLTLLCLDIYLNQKFSFKYFLNKIPMIVLSVVFGIVNLKTQTADLFINYSHEFPFHERIGYAGFALAKYTGMFLAPANLSVLYPYPPNKVMAFVIGFVFIAALLTLLFFLAKKKNWTLFSLILLCIVNLALVLQFVPFGEVLYADRYMYVALIFFTLIASVFISKLKINPQIIAYIFIAVFGFVTFLRLNVWKSSVNLYSDILKKFPDSFVALNSLGAELMFQNEDDKALEALNKALKVSPQNYKGFYNRGLLYLKNGKGELALKSFNQSLAIYDYPKSYVGRASAYYMLKDLPKAMSDAKHVLEMNATNSNAHFILGNCYDDLNRLDEALTEYNKCIELNNEEPDYYFKRGIVMGKKQDFTSCMGDLTICLQFNPLYYEAYYWRGVAKVNLQQNPCEDFKIAARNNFQPAIGAFNKYCR